MYPVSVLWSTCAATKCKDSLAGCECWHIVKCVAAVELTVDWSSLLLLLCVRCLYWRDVTTWNWSNEKMAYGRQKWSHSHVRDNKFAYTLEIESIYLYDLLCVNSLTCCLCQTSSFAYFNRMIHQRVERSQSWILSSSISSVDCDSNEITSFRELHMKLSNIFA